jgi:hypothetical protein
MEDKNPLDKLQFNADKKILKLMETGEKLLLSSSIMKFNE